MMLVKPESLSYIIAFLSLWWQGFCILILLRSYLHSHHLHSIFFDLHELRMPDIQNFVARNSERLNSSTDLLYISFTIIDK